MKINWKEVSKSSGYRSLKAAYIKQVEYSRGWGRGRDKKEMYALFCKIIARATHYAHHQNRPIEDVLEEWQSECEYGFSNHYRNNLKPLLTKPKGKSQEMGLRGHIKYYKTSRRFDPATRKRCVGDLIRRYLPKRDPPREYPKSRWTAKDRRIREYRRELALKK